MFIVGIAGPAQSGKSSIANELYLQLSKDSEWYIHAFADPIKAMIEAMGINNPDQYKTHDHPIFGVTTREMYQTLGTEWGQGLMGKDVWIKALLAKIPNDSDVIISDVRFEHEANFVRNNGVLIHVLGRGGIEGTHSSESGLSKQPSDWIIDNSHTWEHTSNQVKKVVTRILRSDG